jgi:hypothetical protein
LPTVTEVQDDVIIETQKYEIPTEDAHKMTLTAVKDLGWKDVTFAGETKKKKLARLTFRIDDQMAEDDKTPLLIFKTVTQSLNSKSSLVEILNQLGVKVHDKLNIAKLVGVTFTAEVEHTVSKSGDGRIWANLGAITRRTVKLPAAMQAPVTAEAPVEEIN